MKRPDGWRFAVFAAFNGTVMLKDMQREVMGPVFGQDSQIISAREEMGKLRSSINGCYPDLMTSDPSALIHIRWSTVCYTIYNPRNTLLHKARSLVQMILFLLSTGTKCLMHIHMLNL